MVHHRWSVLSPLLDEALELDGERREAWMAGLRAKDPALASELEALLARRGAISRDGFLADTVALPAVTPGLAGATFGAYRLTSLLGQGGMGTVWLADRADGRFEGRAAVKLLNLALVGRAGEDRFRREGNILARLTHPHIARLLDAGVSPGGQPYLVLEHVDGLPIDRYCEQHALATEARLKLLLDVMAAVAHAHANLIVHRDIKPSNVLVRSDGEVKLLDFGIAKLIEGDVAEPATRLTREGGAALTPEYAAPEQLTGADVTTATDVYAIGVLAYVLLTGEHPAGPGSRSTAELVKAITEAEPRRTLPGDLGTIVAKALKKKPEERYQSVTAMAEDVRRYLAHQPISARADTLRYRTVKFVRRNRTAVAAAVLVLAGLSVGLEALNRERQVAERRFQQVRELANKLFDIDAAVRQLPGNSKSRQLIVDTSLDYLRRLGPDAGDDPALALDLGTAYMRVARVQGVPISTNLGQLDEAEKNLRVAQSFIDAVLAKQPDNRTAILRSAQIAHDRMILAGLRRPSDQAIVFARRAAAQLERYLAGGEWEEGDQIALAYMNVANRFMIEGEIDEAIRMSRRTVEIARATNQPRQVAAASVVVAGALRRKADVDGALAALRDAAGALEPKSADAPIMSKLQYGLNLYQQARLLAEGPAPNAGRPAEAIPLLERVIEISDALARQDPQDSESRFRVANADELLGDLLFQSNPAASLTAYDAGLQRLAEIPNNSRARRTEASMLAASTYPLRRLGRAADAKRRLDEAFDRLRSVKLYPADEVPLGNEADEALRALADLEADSNVPHAVAVYEDLLKRILAAKPEPEKNIEEAGDLSVLFTSMADLYRRSGRADLQSDFNARRLAMWRVWDQKVPKNPFIERQLQ